MTIKVSLLTIIASVKRVFVHKMSGSRNLQIAGHIYDHAPTDKRNYLPESCVK